MVRHISISWKHRKTRLTSLTSFPKELVEIADLQKPVLKKIMTTIIKFDFVAPFTSFNIIFKCFSNNKCLSITMPKSMPQLASDTLLLFKNR